MLLLLKFILPKLTLHLRGTHTRKKKKEKKYLQNSPECELETFTKSNHTFEIQHLFHLASQDSGDKLNHTFKIHTCFIKRFLKWRWQNLNKMIKIVLSRSIVSIKLNFSFCTFGEKDKTWKNTEVVCFLIRTPQGKSATHVQHWFGNTKAIDGKALMASPFP